MIDDQIKNLNNLIKLNLENLSKLNKRYNNTMFLTDVQEEDAKLDYVKSATKLKSETSQYDNEINKLKEDKVRYSRLLNDELYENIINDIEEIDENSDDLSLENMKYFYINKNISGVYWDPDISNIEN